MARLFKTLFLFTKQEVDQAFKIVKPRAKAPGLFLLMGQKAALSHGKILIITPRRSGKASNRNRLRRRVKAIFYEEKLYEKPSVSILLVSKPAMELSFDEIKDFLIKNIG